MVDDDSGAAQASQPVDVAALKAGGVQRGVPSNVGRSMKKPHSGIPLTSTPTKRAAT